MVWWLVGVWCCHPYQPQIPSKLPSARLQTHPTQFGMPRWVFPPPGLRFLENIVSAPVVGQQHVYVLTSDSQIYAIDFKGSVSWTWQPKRVQNSGDRILAQPVLSPNQQMLVVGTQQHYLYAIDIDGKEQWGDSCWLPGPITTAPRVTSNNIYITTPGHVKALNLQGQPMWSYRLTSVSHAYTPIQSTDGSVFVAEKSGFLHRISPHLLPTQPRQTCADWTPHKLQPTMYCQHKKLCEQITTAPTKDPSGHLYIGCQDGHMYVLRPDMSIHWKATTEGPILTKPTVSRDGLTVYVGSSDMNLYAYKTSDGSLLWKFRSGRYPIDKQGDYLTEPASGSVMYIKAPVKVDHIGRIYVGSINHLLHTLSPQGKLLWQYDLDGWVEYPPAFLLEPTTNRSTLFLATARRLFAFNF